MKHFKANVIVKVGKRETERKLWIRGKDIIDAMDVTKKVRAIKTNYIIEISREEYIDGVSHA